MHCSWKSTFGIDCLTCGFQRSFGLLLKGEIIESFIMFPATIPFLITCVVFLLHLVFKFIKGAFMIQSSFIITAVLIVSNYVLHMIDGSAFH